jgi:flagellar motility protein MotE (MotC chaperone)
MKFFIQLALAAFLLFSVSAALSVWLYQTSRPADDAGPGEKAGKKKDKEREPERPEKDATEHKTSPKTSPPAAERIDPDTAAALRDCEARLQRRAAQMELILLDMQAEREAIDVLLRQVMAELKAANARSNELEAKAADLGKQRVELDAAERKNLERIAAMYDSMTPETAAPILRQMADSGRMDMAVKVLSQMKERQAARVLSELGDPALAAQLLDRLRGIKAQSPPAASSGTTLPAGGASRSPGP